MTGIPTAKMATPQHLQLRNYWFRNDELNELNDKELIRIYCLNYGDVLFVIDLVREVFQIDREWTKSTYF